MGEVEPSQASFRNPRRELLLVLRLQVALAVIAALRAARRAVACGLGLVAGARFLAAGALHQHAAALAVGDQAALAGRLERLFAARGIGRFTLGFFLSFARLRTIEIRARQGRHLLAELVAQHPGLDLLDLAFGEFAQLERTVGHPDQAVHFETEMRHHIAHLAVLALADRKHQPDIGAGITLQRGIDRAVFDALDLDALFQLVELRLGDLAMGTDAVTPQPAGIGQFQRASEAAVISEQQQAFGVEIEPADRDQPRQAVGQIIEHRRPALGVGMGGHQTARLVKQKQPYALARRQRLAVDGNDVVGGDIERRRIDDAAVDADAALHDPFLGVAARGKASPRHHLGDALAGLLFARRARRAALVGRALAIGAAAAERRAFGQDLGIVLVVAARPLGIAIIGWRVAARMLLPVVPRARLALSARPLEFRPVLAGPSEFRPLPERAIARGAILARLVETPRAFTRRARIAAGMVGRGGIALLPRL